MYDHPKYLISGDSAITVEFGDIIEEASNRRVRELNYAITASSLDGIVETIPTYRSIMIIYNPMKFGAKELIDSLRKMEEKIDKLSIPETRVIEVPVLYGGEYGPDLNHVAEHNKITTEDVINIHSSGEYLIYMLGFTPGFPYLGGMSDRIATPRLQYPRTRIPAGSVGIAGAQTGVYPIESPGGWRLIGRTPMRLYDPSRENPVLLSAGDYVKFIPIDEEEYKVILKHEHEGGYKATIRLRGRG